MKSTLVVLPSLLVSAGLAAQSDAPGHPPPTVADSISMTRLAEPDQRFRASSEFQFSPDGARFVIVTYRGNLETWQNDYRVIVYETDDVLRFVNDDSVPRPEGVVCAQFSAASNDPSMREVRWLDDNRTLLFLREGVEDEPARLYSLRTDTGQLTRLTANERPIETFGVHPTADRVVYLTYVDVPIDELQQPQFVVGNKDIAKLTVSRGIDAWNFQFFVTEKGHDGPGTPVGDPIPKKGARASALWVSPDGRWAIATRKAESLAEDWKLPELPGIRGLLRRYDPYHMGYRTGPLIQYVLLDLEQHTVRPVFAAPLPDSGARGAHWLPDSRSVVLLGTHLPLEGADAAERARRNSTPVVAEFRPDTGEFERVVDLPSDGGRSLTGAEVDSSGVVTLHWREGSARLVQSCEKRGGSWHMLEAQPAPEPEKRQLELTLRQDASTPPDVFARDAETGAERALTDLNPQLREIAFGKVESVSWTDSEGRQWGAALVYPSAYEPDQRYPLVIQTSASGGDGKTFAAREFLIDGPVYSSAYAAQALAGRGLMVLQVPNPFPFDGQLVRQLHDTRAMVESAIDALDQRELIDRARVAMVGFSNTCVPVWHILTHSDYDFAAAVVADGYSHSHWGYASTFGVRSPAMLYIDELVMGGATPWGEGLEEWIALSPSFHLDKVDAAVRMEEYSDDTPPMSWDLYAILRRLHKPVEYAILTDGAHNNLKPLERYLSQQGNVDWLAFWLKGEEDPDPKKAEQYARWREMRSLRK